MRKKKLKEFMLRQQPCMVGMEACGTAHYWARLFRSWGHEVKLIAPQFVKPYVKSNKNDAVDAEAICEAIQHPNMRFVAIKETDQQNVQAIHRIAQPGSCSEDRTGQSGQGLLQEFGIDIPKGRANTNKHLPDMLKNGENGFSDLFRKELYQLYQELLHLDERVEHFNQKIETLAR